MYSFMSSRHITWYFVHFNTVLKYRKPVSCTILFDSAVIIRRKNICRIFDYIVYDDDNDDEHGIVMIIITPIIIIIIGM